MDLLEKKTDKELLESLIAEAAKAQNELNCARKDLEKAQNRLKFVLMVSNTLVDRQGD